LSKDLVNKSKESSLRRCVAELEQVNMDLEGELDRSNKMTKTLEARNDLLKSGNIKLHEKIADLESKAKAWGEEKMDIEKSFKEKIDDVEDDYEAYCMTCRKR
jgi:chromosome segregation ATPase